MDIVDRKTRSQMMSSIKSKNTKPEITVRSYLHSRGFRYRLHDKRLPGKPDIVLPKYKTVIFVNGCFWHRHKECKYAYMPKSRVEFWKTKFQDNVSRFKIVKKLLEKAGWKILVVWECEIPKRLSLLTGKIRSIT